MTRSGSYLPVLLAIAVLAAGCGGSTKTVTENAPQKTVIEHAPASPGPTTTSEDADDVVAGVAGARTCTARWNSEASRNDRAAAVSVMTPASPTARAAAGYKATEVGSCLITVENEASESFLQFSESAGLFTQSAFSSTADLPGNWVWNASVDSFGTITVGTTAPAPRPPTPSPAAADPAAIISQHFENINSGNYQAAFGLLTASYQARNPSWVSDRQTAGAGINVISVGTPQYVSDGAQVPVEFYARDRYATRGSDIQCREFTGTVHMVKESGGWRYDPSASSLHPSVVDPSNPNCPS